MHTEKDQRVGESLILIFYFSPSLQQRAIQLTVKSLQQNLTGAAESFQRVSSEVLEGMRSTSVPRQQLDMVSQSCVCVCLYTQLSQCVLGRTLTQQPYQSCVCVRVCTQTCDTGWVVPRYMCMYSILLIMCMSDNHSSRIVLVQGRQYAHSNHYCHTIFTTVCVCVCVC